MLSRDCFLVFCASFFSVTFGMECNWNKVGKCAKPVIEFNTALEQNPRIQKRLLNKHCDALARNQECIENGINECTNSMMRSNKNIVKLVNILGNSHAMHYMCMKQTNFHRHRQCLLDPVVIRAVDRCLDDVQYFGDIAGQIKSCSNLQRSLKCIRTTVNNLCHNPEAAELQYQHHTKKVKPIMDLMSCSSFAYKGQYDNRIDKNAYELWSVLGACLVTFLLLVISCPLLCVYYFRRLRKSRNVEETSQSCGDEETADDGAQNPEVSPEGVATIVISNHCDVVSQPPPYECLGIGDPPPYTNEEVAIKCETKRDCAKKHSQL